jgi:hypothetical protein
MYLKEPIQPATYAVSGHSFGGCCHKNAGTLLRLILFTTMAIRLVFGCMLAASGTSMLEK